MLDGLVMLLLGPLIRTVGNSGCAVPTFMTKFSGRCTVGSRDIARYSLYNALCSRYGRRVPKHVWTKPAMGSIQAQLLV